MRRPHSALCLTPALAAACGGSRASVDPGGETQSTVRVASGAGERGGVLTTTSSYRGLVDALDAPVDSLWPLMPAVYTEVGLDFTTLDQARRVTATTRCARQWLGRVPLSRYLSCGQENGRENADRAT